MTSSLFSLDNTVDRELIFQIWRYELSIHNFNRILKDVDWDCTRKGVSQEFRREKYRDVNESKLYKNYLDSHKKTKKYLYENYNWAFSERMGEILEKFMKRSILPEDPNMANSPIAK